ncbi:hypothetical protein WNY59_09620 [Ahrensia kielensis]|uniref:Uncharacterized protein n=1 Tax=Ahrensia kielensis TaxID=76980 RepID=A0ABU9T6U4_9HYPH
MKGARSIVYPTRKSDAPLSAFSRSADGYIKVRLAHGVRGTVLLPDALFYKQSVWYYFLPSFFGPPLLAFGIPNEADGMQFHNARFSIDISAPHAIHAARIMIEIKSTDLCTKYRDDSQLYKCKIFHEESLVQNAAGKCRKIDDDFWISVFHHTTAEVAKLIKNSGHFRGSEWNIQGTRNLKNVCYPYFTTMPKIRDSEDLQRIAMSSNEKIDLLGTGYPPVRVTLKVYREKTENRTTSIRVRLPISIVSPAHLRLFDPDDQFEPSYYEVVQPEIVRVGLKPGTVLEFSGSRVLPVQEALKNFDYVICGNANSEVGLIAPYDEEETNEVLHFEKLENSDLFDFWQHHANTDQTSDRTPEPRMLSDKTE